MPAQLHTSETCILSETLVLVGIARNGLECRYWLVIAHLVALCHRVHRYVFVVGSRLVVCVLHVHAGAIETESEGRKHQGALQWKVLRASGAY